MKYIQFIKYVHVDNVSFRRMIDEIDIDIRLLLYACLFQTFYIGLMLCRPLYVFSSICLIIKSETAPTLTARRDEECFYTP